MVFDVGMHRGEDTELYLSKGFRVVAFEANPNLVKKVIGLNVFQTAVFIFYISLGEREGGTAPILGEGYTLYVNPLPHVLILTAIVVGVATTALALALIVRIHRAYETVEEDDIDAADAGEEAPR